MAIDDGGPVYPIPDVEMQPGSWRSHYMPVSDGVSVRTLAAIEIMKGLVSNPSVVAPDSRIGWGLANCTEGQLATYALGLADSLLATIKAGG